MNRSHSAPISDSAKQIRILVADHNPLDSQLLAEALGRHPRFVIADIVIPEKIMPLVPVHKIDVAVIGVDFDGTRKGLQVARLLSARYPEVRIVVLPDVDSRESVMASFRCGAMGVFCRTGPLSELHICIERVSRGEIWASRSHSQFVLEALRSIPSCEAIETGRIGLLSHRELQVAECAAQGHSNKQIADRLGLSEHTIKNYLFRTFEKLGVSSRVELLFLLFKESNTQATARGGIPFGAEIGHPIEAYIKAAEEGVVAAQFIVGLAHLEGYCVERNERSAYYWLRLAEKNSGSIGQRSHDLLEELRSAVKTAEIEAMEHSIAVAVQKNKLLTSKRPAEFIKASPNSAPRAIARELSAGNKAKAKVAS
jgi:two-component system, NarL family, nitrate/nitrite response regulator NarL